MSITYGLELLSFLRREPIERVADQPPGFTDLIGGPLPFFVKLIRRF
jgi:hypothetical protein